MKSDGDRNVVIELYPLIFRVMMAHQPENTCPELEFVLQSRKHFNEYILKQLCSRCGNILMVEKVWETVSVKIADGV